MQIRIKISVIHAGFINYKICTKVYIAGKTDDETIFRNLQKFFKIIKLIKSNFNLSLTVREG